MSRWIRYLTMLCLLGAGCGGGKPLVVPVLFLGSWRSEAGDLDVVFTSGRYEWKQGTSLRVGVWKVLTDEALLRLQDETVKLPSGEYLDLKAVETPKYVKVLAISTTSCRLQFPNDSVITLHKTGAAPAPAAEGGH